MEAEDELQRRLGRQGVLGIGSSMLIFADAKERNKRCVFRKTSYSRFGCRPLA